MIYSDENRGVILFKDRMKQLIQFRGLKMGNITPMDVDGMIEYHDKAYVFYEFKYNGAPFADGERIALERLANDAEKVGKEAVILLCEHYVEDTNEIVDASTAIVKKYYYKQKWDDGFGKSAKAWTDRFINHVKQIEVKQNES